MIRQGVMALFLIGVAAHPAARTAEPPGIRKGMTRNEVKQVLGVPQRVSRIVLFRRHFEQWHYVDPPRWVEFNCVRGEEPFVHQFRLGS